MADLEPFAVILAEMRDLYRSQIELAKIQAERRHEEVVRSIALQERSVINQEIIMRRQRSSASLYRILVVIAVIALTISLLSIHS